jgi:parallel beta-helix repeat protein
VVAILLPSLSASRAPGFASTLAAGSHCRGPGKQWTQTVGSDDDEGAGAGTTDVSNTINHELMKRRRFLSHLAGAAALCSFDALAIDACSESPTAPGRGRTAAHLLNVRDFGATGGGMVDDTPAFAAVMRAVGRGGGAIFVPDGTYLIDPRQSIVMADNTFLELSRGAVLQAIAVSNEMSAVVLIRDVAHVTIVGGTIVGERFRHAGVLGEWGMGVDVRGASDIRIDGVTVRECWGDGIYVGGGSGSESRRVIISGCRSLDNRRQGLSLTGCISAIIEASEFRGTGGTPPQAGIDLEPNVPYSVRDVTIRDCMAARNAGPGILLSGITVTEVTIERNRCTENADESGITLHRASRCTVRWNMVEWNNKAGIRLDQASDNVVSGNAIRHNSQGQPLRWSNVMLHSAAANAVSENQFVDGNGTVETGPRYDVSVPADCHDNRIVSNHLRPRQLDALGQPVGGIDNNSATTVVADNR